LPGQFVNLTLIFSSCLLVVLQIAVKHGEHFPLSADLGLALLDACPCLAKFAFTARCLRLFHCPGVVRCTAKGTGGALFQTTSFFLVAANTEVELMVFFTLLHQLLAQLVLFFQLEQLFLALLVLTQKLFALLLLLEKALLEKVSLSGPFNALFQVPQSGFLLIEVLPQLRQGMCVQETFLFPVQLVLSLFVQIERLEALLQFLVQLLLPVCLSLQLLPGGGHPLVQAAAFRLFLSQMQQLLLQAGKLFHQEGIRGVFLQEETQFFPARTQLGKLLLDPLPFQRPCH